MELYLIRHAQSVNNALVDQRQRVCDSPLTELGHQQAQLVGRHIAAGVDLEMTLGGSEEATSVRQRRGYGLGRLYCSAMHRAMQTAGYISQATGLKPEMWLDIHEVGGIYDGHPDDGDTVGRPGIRRSEVLAEFPHYILPPNFTDDGWWNRPHEDWAACCGRALRVAKILRQMARDLDEKERVGLVSHGGFMDALLKALTNQLPGEGVFHHHFNTAITRLDLRPDGHVGIRYLNRVPHLTPDLVS